MVTEYALLVDGNNLAMRIIKALEYSRTEMSVGDDNTGPTHVFGQSMMRYVAGYLPDRVVVCFDGGRNQRRMALHPGYKGSRPKRTPEEELIHRDRFELIKAWTTLFGGFAIERGDLEADDLIALYVQKFRGSNTHVRILSADKDMLQLVSPTVEVLAPNPKEDVLWTVDSVVEKYKCLPWHLPILNALKGDVSDDIDGIPGIGPKRAHAIGDECQWDIDRVLQHPKVADHRVLVERNLALVDMAMVEGDLLLPPLYQRLQVGTDQWEAMQMFCRRFGLDRLEKQMESNIIGWGTRNP